jgi:hypothetical protein
MQAVRKQRQTFGGLLSTSDNEPTTVVLTVLDWCLSGACYIHVGKGWKDGRPEGRKGQKDG